MPEYNLKDIFNKQIGLLPVSAKLGRMAEADLGFREKLVSSTMYQS